MVKSVERHLSVRTLTKPLILAVVLCAGFGGAARADLIGDLVDIQYVWPSAGAIESDLGTITVTSTPQTLTFQPYFDVSASGSQIIVDDSDFFGGTYTGTFNGQYLIDESVTTFPTVAIDASSVLTGGTPDITIAGNTLEINFAGLTFGPGSELVLDVGSSAPEPATFGLLGVAVMSLAFLRRRRAS
jgi:hypothetical protein